MTRDGKGLNFLQGLFTAVSSVCVTGLTLIDPAFTLTKYGQILLAVLIEIGGISMVTFGSFFIFTFKKRFGLRSMRLAQEYTNIDAFSLVKNLVRVIIATAFSCQFIGAIMLCFRFIPLYGAKGIWISVFTAISAYCNAGFDLFGAQNPFGSLIGFNGDPYVMGVVMALIIMGGIGFFVFYDLITWRKTHKLSLHTKVMLMYTGILILTGFVFFLLFEWNNADTLGALPVPQRILAALFQSVTARTAGFSSIDLAKMHDVTKIIMMFLMFIGAGSGSTAGGIKVTTFAVLATTVVSVIKNRSDTAILGKRVDRKIVAKSLTISFLGLLVVFACACVILYDIPNGNGINVFFESVSAFATVGVTSGITMACNVLGLCALMVTMFIGRLGPVSVIIALNIRESRERGEVLPEGRIMVG